MSKIGRYIETQIELGNAIYDEQGDYFYVREYSHRERRTDAGAQQHPGVAAREDGNRRIVCAQAEHAIRPIDASAKNPPVSEEQPTEKVFDEKDR